MDTLGTLPEGMEGAGWAVSWRVLCHRCEGNPVPLPIPKAKQFFATFREMFKASVRSQQQQQQAPFHRCVCGWVWGEGKDGVKGKGSSEEWVWVCLWWGEGLRMY